LSNIVLRVLEKIPKGDMGVVLGVRAILKMIGGQEHLVDEFSTLCSV